MAKIRYFSQNICRKYICLAQNRKNVLFLRPKHWTHLNFTNKIWITENVGKVVVKMLVFGCLRLITE